ncbi:uncharacterized protein EI97DRAFT_501876 [Westerdykella ornata]|uniref:Rhodopsin domain-containing protein n=1 Tax=Westerdykella ornata TaxID=318751 RepID=A0A6A6JGN5_WESOR|nr:uncharacterized protein EI97DRAFT_501876 [Westerdykella ornata]KAF2275721.1 hypothetical protein EI97DRAFT_501876 [Westerdykella ornata]
MAPLPHNPLGVAVLAVASVGVTLSAFCISLRLWARRLLKKRWATSDYLLMAAWVFALADFVRRIIGFQWGLGLHMEQILATQGTTHVFDIFKLNYSSYFIWVACATLTKFSILLIYLELFYCITWFVWAVRVMMAIVVVFFFVTIVGMVMICKPFEANWNLWYQGAKCSMTQGDQFVFSAAFNIALDIILVLLPIPVVWTLNISKWKRVAVCAMFGLGFFIIGVVGYRFKLIPDRNLYDITHDGEVPGILSQVELYLGMVSACLPFLSPALSKMRTTVVESKAFSYILSQTGTSRSSLKDYSYGTKLSETSGERRRNDNSHEKLPHHYAESKRSDEEEMVGGFDENGAWSNEIVDVPISTIVVGKK